MGYARKDVEKTKKLAKKFVRYQKGADVYKRQGWLEYGCKRDKRYGCICAHKIKETGERNRNQLSDLSTAFCTGRVPSK